CDNSVALAATPVVIGRGTWSVLSGSGTFSDSHASNASVSNIGSGINTYRWTITNNLCSSTSEVVVNNGKPLYTSAGIDQTICADSTTLAANSPQLGKGVWRIMRGAGILDDVYNPTSVIRSLGPDTTILRWTVTNNQCVDYQEVRLVNNLPTVAAAGAIQTICADKTTLDGNAPLIGNGIWTVISGSGSFANDKLYNTVVQNLSRGPNIIRWTISKHDCSFTSDVTIRNDMPTLPDAGIDLAVCGNSAMLNGTKPAVGKGRWTVVSGGGVFSDSSKYNTQVTGLVQGNNVFRWTITNNQCVFSDTMLVKDNQADVYAGPDQIIYVDNAKLAGNKPIRGAGIWSLDAGAGTIVSPSTYETNVTGLGEGVNTFKWSIDIDGCISSSSVKVSYYRKPVPVFSASTEEGCAPLTVKLTNTTIGNYPFQWSLGESGIISADASPVYTYTTPGTYTVKLMVTGPDGQLVTAMKTITVHPVPKAKFDVVTKDLYIPGDELRCYNTSEGAENWLWNFGDGTSSADFNGVHTYADSGVYNIKLVALS
ncbi:MAG: PKD domain-containing protein, partial [Bacteroidota bacterium]|nr:PKD domain-containing protein [Bacteroidota bacterium]